MAPDQPTAEQIENARKAGWDPDLGPPPGGWDVHGTPPPDDPELGNNGIAPTDAAPLFNEDGTERQ
jgi:hypothetical protein